MRVRLLAAIVLLFAVLFPGRARAEDGGEAGSTGAPTTIEELRTALENLTRRLDRLLELANTDPRMRLVQEYMAYTPADFENSKRVEAKDLVEFMSDEDASSELRKAAYEALTSDLATRHDPDLVLERDGGRRKPRAQFAGKEVAKLLADKDESTRKYANSLLKKWFPRLATDPAATLYDPVNGSRTDWQKAYRHWKNALR